MIFIYRQSIRLSVAIKNRMFYVFTLYIWSSRSPSCSPSPVRKKKKKKSSRKGSDTGSDWFSHQITFVGLLCGCVTLLCVFVMTAFKVSSSLPPGLPQGRDDTGTFYIYLMFCLLLVLFPRIKGTVLFRKCR